MNTHASSTRASARRTIGRSTCCSWCFPGMPETGIPTGWKPRSPTGCVARHIDGTPEFASGTATVTITMLEDARPIGLFDSGLGGLTVVRALLDLVPEARLVYFGDTGRFP